MADVVRMQMERMVPELEEYELLHIFSKAEIRQIVQKRENLEYQMQRTPLRQMDCLRYIEYEINLDALKRLRKKKIGMAKALKHEYAIQRRVHFIFERTVKKYHGDIQLWLQYIEYCKSTDSSKTLSKVFSRCLQLHPRNEGMWIEAANWEFQTNGSMDAARVLLQRAIRINPQSERLYHEYFRLELLFIQKIRARRDFLGLASSNTDKPSQMDGEGNIALESQDESASAAGTLDESTEAILQGAIPIMVYKNATTKCSDSIDFRLEFIAIAEMFEPAIAENVCLSICEALVVEFPQDLKVQVLKATRPTSEAPLHSEAYFHMCIKNFEQLLQEQNTNEMRMAYVGWLEKKYSTSLDIPVLSSKLAKQLKSVFLTFQENNIFSLALYLKYIDFALHAEGLPAAIEIAKKAVGKLSQHTDLWLIYGDCVARSQSITQAIEVFEEGIKQVNSEGQARVWQRLLELQMTVLNPADMTALFKSALHSLASRPAEELYCVREQFLIWSAVGGSIEATRGIYREFFNGPMLPTNTTHRLLALCIELEKAQARTPETVKAIEKLYERSVDLFGQTDVDLWVEYVRYFRSYDEFAKANQIQWRGSKALVASAKDGFDAAMAM